MRTVIASDLHLGAGSRLDLLRRDEMLSVLLEAIAGVDRVILLGDVVELRDRPMPETIANAAPVLAAIGEAVGDAELVVVPGNHDHHLIEPWLEQRSLESGAPLELEHRPDVAGPALELLARHLEPASLGVAYPGVWLRENVYATHGHYLDRHLTIPTFERLGVALVERLLGIAPVGPDPLVPEEEHEPAIPDDYERVQMPVYAFLFELAQATVGARSGGADPSMRVWRMLSGGESRVARMRSWLLGSVALPGAVGVANRLGLGPVGADLSPRAIARAGIDAMGEVVEDLRIDAAHVIFGHTHRRGPIGGEPGWSAGDTSLWNTGSWVHAPSLLGADAAVSPYWPGTIAVVEDEGPPELRHLLDDLSREELAAGG